jgi:hypothetical protein
VITLDDETVLHDSVHHTEQEWGRAGAHEFVPWGVRFDVREEALFGRSTMLTLEYFTYPRDSPRQGPAPYLESPAGDAETLFGIAFAEMGVRARPTARLRQHMIDRVIYVRLVTAVKCHR